MTFWETVDAGLVTGGLIALASGRHKLGISLIVAGVLLYAIDQVTAGTATT